MSKTDDRMILRPVSQDSPGSDSTAEPPSEKCQKQLILTTQTSSLEKRRRLWEAPRASNHSITRLFLLLFFLFC